MCLPAGRFDGAARGAGTHTGYLPVAVHAVAKLFIHLVHRDDPRSHVERVIGGRPLEIGAIVR